MFGKATTQMMSLLECSDEAFIKIINQCAGDEGWEIMFGDATPEEVLQDRVEAIECVVAYMESLYDMDVAVV
jgi:hypothetical protein